MAKATPFRFSTKFQDEETDLLYYGYRFYTANTGRWISNDPVLERVFATRVARVAQDELSSKRPDSALENGFLRNSPANLVDVLGLDVYKMREKSKNSCCPDHRLIIGDMGGTNAGWSYVIHVAGPDGTSCCGIRNVKGTTRHIFQSAGHYTAKEAVAKWVATKQYSVMAVATTDSEVDAELAAEAKALDGKPWDYLFIWSDCGTFANQWLDKAKRKQQERHPKKPEWPRPNPL